MEDLSESIEFKNVKTSNKKKQIILSETKRNYKNYINSLKYRYNGKNPYLPNYVVTKNGEIFKIIKDNQHTKFIGIDEIDNKSINIVLENYGWLKKNPIDNTYVNFIGDIYKGEVYEKKWRDQLFWDTYQEKQIESLSKLIVEICDKLNIKKECIGTNVRNDESLNFEGIVSKSNFDYIYKDINPSFNFKLLNEKIK
jgi:N-acetyl-anhydromuramyl-L-alanine amidase AmpD